MVIGVPREIKQDENRVALMPSGAEALINHGHSVLVEREAVADGGWRAAAQESPALAAGVNVVEGQVTHPGVAEAWRTDLTQLSDIL